MSGMYVTRSQKFFTYLGYYSNEFSRIFFRNAERLIRSIPRKVVSKPEAKDRLQWLSKVIFSLPLALLLFPVSLAFYVIAAIGANGRRFELIQSEFPENFSPVSCKDYLFECLFSRSLVSSNRWSSDTS